MFLNVVRSESQNSTLFMFFAKEESVSKGEGSSISSPTTRERINHTISQKQMASKVQYLLFLIVEFFTRNRATYTLWVFVI